MKDLSILPEVHDDLAKSVAWYGRQSGPEVGDRLVAAFRKSLGKIRQSGEMRRTAYSDFRRILLKPFPYIVFYRLSGETWVVVLLIHSARSPERIRSLLDGRKSVP